jgi:PAS domain S-box-containing protein
VLRGQSWGPPERPVTEVDRARRLLDAQSTVLEKIARSTPLQEVLDVITTSVEELGDDVLCSFLLMNDDGRTVRHGSAPSLPPDYVKAIDGLAIGPSAGSCGTAAYMNKSVVVTDVATDPLWDDYRHLALAHGLRACWSTPVRSSIDGSVLGTFAMYYREPQAPSAIDEELVRFSVHLASIAIERVLQERSLLESEELFRAVFDHAPAGIALTGLDGRITRANVAFQELVGYSAAELHQMAVSEFTFPEDLRVEAKLTEEVSQGKRDGYRLEKRYVRQDGATVWVDLSAAIIRGPDGEPRFGMGMVQDITERRRLEEQLILSQRLEALGRLAGGIAHDFNNLLQVIMTASENLPSGDERSAANARLIQRAADDGARLVTQLLAYARKQVIRPVQVCPNSLLKDDREMVTRVLGEDVVIDYELQDDLWEISIDPGQFSQMFMNLIMNAREAMPTGGNVRVETRNEVLTSPQVWHGGTLPPGEYVRIGVVDDGLGMSEDVLMHLFEPFFSTKPMAEGSGLGLSMIYGIVSGAEGGIFIESAPEEGASFVICLPRSEVP